MAKIPKIAWFHYEGPPMSWLRKRGIQTFRDQNPSWDVRVIGTPKDIAATPFVRWPQKHGDWAGWRMLNTVGGFMMHSDAVYVRPMLDEWLDYDLVAQLTGGTLLRNGMRVHQIPAFGAKPGNELMKRLDLDCEKSPDSKFYNYGVQLINSTAKTMEGGILGCGDVFNLSSSVFCPYDWDEDPYNMWGPEGPRIKHTEDTVGIHWYAGHPRSREEEAGSGPDCKSWIETIAASGELP